MHTAALKQILINDLIVNYQWLVRDDAKIMNDTKGELNEFEKKQKRKIFSQQKNIKNSFFKRVNEMFAAMEEEDTLEEIFFCERTLNGVENAKVAIESFFMARNAFKWIK